MEKQVNRTQGYRPDIESLRGVAAGLVVAYHAAYRLCHGGFIGVDVFLVISGNRSQAFRCARSRRLAGCRLPGSTHKEPLGSCLHLRLSF